MRGYVRHTVLPGKCFKRGTYRTIDPGRPGHTKLVIGRLKSGAHKGKTRVHQVLQPRLR